MTSKSLFCVAVLFGYSCSVYAMDGNRFLLDSSDSEDDTQQEKTLVFKPESKKNKNDLRKGPFMPTCHKGIIPVTPVSAVAVGEGPFTPTYIPGIVPVTTSIGMGGSVAAAGEDVSQGGENNRPLTPFAHSVIRRTLSGMVRDYQKLNPQSEDAAALAQEIAQHPDFSRAAQTAGACSFKDFMQKMAQKKVLHEHDETAGAALVGAVGALSLCSKESQANNDVPSDDDVQEYV